MTNSAWGKKRVCNGCSVRYYDLRKSIPTCPKCGATMDIQNQEKGRKRVLSVMSSSEMERIEGLNLEEEPSPTLEDEVLEEDSFDDSVSPLDPATSVEI